MKVPRRLAVLVAAMGLAVIFAAGTAVAAVIEGSSGNNVIDGTVDADTLNGNGGNDTIQGFGGSDEVDGGDGADRLYAYDDQGTVATGDDRVLGRIGNDQIEGGSGADTLVGGPGDDFILEGPHDDSSVDRINGSDGNDTIYAGNERGVADVITCGAGDDRVKADPVDEIAADCETLLPNQVDRISYSSEDSAGGDVIPTSEEYPAGAEIGGAGVQELDANGNVLEQHTETYVAGKPDATTGVDASRQPSDLAAQASYCKKVWAWRTHRSNSGDVLVRWYQYKYFCWNGNNVYNVQIWTQQRDVKPNMNYIGTSGKWGYYWTNYNGHGSYREAHYFNEIVGYKYSDVYPWVQIWVRNNGSWDFKYGTA